MPKIVLHQWLISPYCGKVRRILEHKGLAYETINYNGLLARKAASLTPIGKLPVLDYDGERIADSSDIAQFLEHKHPAPALFPTDPVQRARAHFWEDWADESLGWCGLYLRFMYPEARARAVALLAEGRSGLERTVMAVVLPRVQRKVLVAHGVGRMAPAQVEARVREHLDALDAVLAAQRWLVGDARTIADVAVTSQLAEMVRTSHLAAEITERSRIQDWLTRA